MPASLVQPSSKNNTGNEQALDLQAPVKLPPVPLMDYSPAWERVVGCQVPCWPKKTQRKKPINSAAFIPRNIVSVRSSFDARLPVGATPPNKEAP